MLVYNTSSVSLIMSKEFVASSTLGFKGLLFVQTVQKCFAAKSWKISYRPKLQTLCSFAQRSLGYSLCDQSLKQHMHHSAWKAKQSHRGLGVRQCQKGKESVSEQLNHTHCR